jgi:hypothetical protein
MVMPVPKPLWNKNRMAARNAFSNQILVFIGRIDLVFMINGDKGQTDDHHGRGKPK